MMWYCLPSEMRMSSISSFRLSAFIVFSLARTTSVLPAVAASTSMPEPTWPSDMPLLLSTSATSMAPSIVMTWSSDSFRFDISSFLRWLLRLLTGVLLVGDALRSGACRPQNLAQRRMHVADDQQHRGDARACHRHGHQTAHAGLDDDLAEDADLRLDRGCFAQAEQGTGHRAQLGFRPRRADDVDDRQTVRGREQRPLELVGLDQVGQRRICVRRRRWHRWIDRHVVGRHAVVT